jgi:hypothetical protein
MNEKAKFLSLFHKKCPYCERKFRKKKHFVNEKIMRKMLDNWFNPENC